MFEKPETATRGDDTAEVPQRELYDGFPEYWAELRKFILEELDLYEGASETIRQMREGCTIHIMDVGGWSDTVMELEREATLDRHSQLREVLLHPSPNEVAERSTWNPNGLKADLDRLDRLCLLGLRETENDASG